MKSFLLSIGLIFSLILQLFLLQSWQAEVIVPNSQLVSAQVINWTHSDQERRISIPIGVAYGTDPQLTIDTLVNIANETSDVLDNPAPLAFFVRFGASSMDFELRVWVNNGDIINEVNSKKEEI